MSRKRTIGTIAAFGGLTATVALLSGLPAAKADELADLRANQELLQQRLDQLAQAPISPVGGLYPGGLNEMPAMHRSAGLAHVANIQPLDTAGQPSPTGKYVLTGGNRPPRSSWFTTVWRKEKDGWRMIHDHS